MKKATKLWVRKAEEDYAVAQTLQRNRSAYHDAVSFHCHQCVEKYLKALLVESNEPFPKTHDLDRLLKLVTPHHTGLRKHRRGLLFLSAFAVEARYPGFEASKRQAASALRWSGRVRDEIRRLLGQIP